MVGHIPGAVARALDQHHVTRAQVVRERPHRGRLVGHQHRLPFPLSHRAGAVEVLRAQLRPGDVVLVKGSRYRTWDVADALREDVRS